MEDLRLHLEQFIERDAILGILVLRPLLPLPSGLLTGFLHLRHRPFSRDRFSHFCSLRQVLSSTAAASARHFHTGASGNCMAASCSWMFCMALGPTPAKPSTLFSSNLRAIIRLPMFSISGFDQDIEDVLLEAKLFERHGKGGRRHLGSGRIDPLFVRAHRLFLDLGGAAFDAVNKLTEQRVFFRCEQAGSLPFWQALPAPAACSPPRPGAQRPARDRSAIWQAYRLQLRPPT